MQAGLHLTNALGETLEVVSQTALEQTGTVYNIQVHEHNTYHVGEMGVWVHNADCCNVKGLASKGAGEVKIIQGATPDTNELRAGKGLADQFGYEVIHQPTASQLGIQGKRTADMTVTGVGQVDVYTPVNTSVKGITRAIEGKNKQATAILVQASIGEADMATVAARTWGKPTAKKINTIFFQKQDGSIVIYNRPIGG